MDKKSKVKLLGGLGTLCFAISVIHSLAEETAKIDDALGLFWWVVAVGRTFLTGPFTWCGLVLLFLGGLVCRDDLKRLAEDWLRHQGLVQDETLDLYFDAGRSAVNPGEIRLSSITLSNRSPRNMSLEFTLDIEFPNQNKDRPKHFIADGLWGTAGLPNASSSVAAINLMSEQTLNGWLVFRNPLYPKDIDLARKCTLIIHDIVTGNIVGCSPQSGYPATTLPVTISKVRFHAEIRSKGQKNR